MDKQCKFCDQELIKERKYLENDIFVCRWEKTPVSVGHSIVIPKRHVVSFFKLEEKEVVALYEIICEARKIIQEKHNPDGYNIGINEGEAAGRTIHHFHLHIMPRYKGDVPDPKGGVRHVIPGKGYYQ